MDAPQKTEREHKMHKFRFCAFCVPFLFFVLYRAQF
jgi:hypothetical protein